MNTKKNKNKNRPNKPPNPNPPQKVEEVPLPIDTEVYQTPEIKESVSQIEERVPELISDVLPVLTSEAKPDETPKKPKRNRGKKKNQDTEDKEPIPVESQETKLQTEELKVEDVPNVPEVAPSARKKKNKGIKSCETINITSEIKDEKSIEKEEIEITGGVKVEAKVEVLPIAESLLEQEGKSSKKKNKKKKHRNDSEKSDKADELSCVAAFQKLLKDEKSEIKDEIICKLSGEGENKSDSIEVAKVEEKVVIPELAEDDIFDVSKQPFTETCIGKKKNKKDKKNPPTEEKKEMILAQTPASEVKSCFASVSSQSDISSTEVKEDISTKEFVLVGNITIDEDNLKSKAKIAKPVERKRKEKSGYIKESVSDSTVEDIKTPITEKKQAKEEFKLDNKQSHEETTYKGELPKTTSPAKDVVLVTMPSMDVLSTKDAGKGKNRKKSPKPKNRDKTAEIDEKPAHASMTINVDFESIISESEEKPKEKSTLTLTEITEKTEIESDALSTPDNEKGNKRKKSPKPKKQHLASETDETPIQTSLILDVVPESSDSELDVKPEEEAIIPLIEMETKTDNKSETLSNLGPEQANKRKKSPKPKKQHLTVETEEKPVQESITVNVVTESIRAELEENPKEKVTLPSTETEIITEIKGDTLPTPDIEKGSKRKKSPKPKKYQESSETQSQCETTVIKNVSEDIASGIVLKSEGVKLEDIIGIAPPLTEIDTDIVKSVTKSDLLPDQDKQTDKKNKKSSKQKKHHQMVEGDAIQVQKNITVDTAEKIVIETEVKPDEKIPEEAYDTLLKTEIYEEAGNKTPESKTRKKGKKLPRLPSETKGETETPLFEGDWSKESFKEEFVGDKTEFSGSLPSQDDIEISSLKAEESEGSTCGVTPDLIQYPRATSQELIDDNNNNMIIAEITVIEETRLAIPVQIPDTPLICRSGETPLVTPEIQVPSTSMKFDQLKESEKTDIKSKMMEVNQDMEELRLSIERSLAELTSIEKNEEELEIGFADKMLVITEESLSMPSENIAKAETGKKDLTTQLAKDSPSKNTTVIIETSQKCTLDLENKDMKMETASVPPLSTEPTEITTEPILPPVCPARKDNKNKGKSKKKGKQETSLPAASTESIFTTTSESSEQDKTAKKEEKTEQKTECTKEKSKQQTELATENKDKKKTEEESLQETTEFDPIDNFEDAMTSSADDINKSFEMIANDSNQVEASHVNPEIKIIAPIEDRKQEKRDEKVNPLSQPKNLLGHPDIPVSSNKIDYKKEKNKSPNETLAKVKIKDSIEVEAKRQSKESQTDNIRKFMKNKSIDEPFSLVNENDDFVYKYSFRRVFLQSSCHVCKKELKQSRVPCSYCCLVFYCSGKHKDEDWTQHQALCFAVSTISHLKDQKHIYADAKNITGQNYRLLRMQMIVSCEKVLKRRLVPWEQEALLYPRICADICCREWRQSKLVDCEGCGQISYCIDHPDHFPKSHQRWCKSYSLYQKLVSYQQTKGRLEPKLPSKVIMDYQMPEKMNEVLASMYEEKIDMSDIQYAALTQIATAPLTAAYCYQMARKHQPHANGTCKKKTCTIHVVDAELQFEADALNKWEVFFLHLMPVEELRVVMISVHLNPGNLPLELLSKIKLCEDCRLKNRRVIFNFQDKQTYYEYWTSKDYITPNLVCAFNANINRSSLYNTKDPWPKTINCILKQKIPFLITDHTLNEIHKDVASVKEIAEKKYNVIVEPKTNNFASVRPDRNFISDDEMPLLFKNYCFALLIGVN